MTVVSSVNDSGIRVVTEVMPSMRSVTLGLWFDVGSRDEADDEHGCSHFLEHLLFKGTPRRDAKQIAEELDAIGGESNAFTSREMTCFYARVLDRELPTAVDVLADMMRNASNTPDDVEAERDVVLEEINIYLDTPEDLVHSDLSEVVLAGHPLGRETLGTEESVEGLSRDLIDGYYRRWYRPANLVVAAAGNLAHDQILGIVDEQLGDLGRPGEHRRPREAPERYASGQVHIRHRPTEQAHVAMGAPGLALGDDDRVAFGLLVNILGGGMSSRLFQSIREERGLAYSTYAYGTSYTDGGLFGAYAGTTPAKIDEVCGLMVDELHRAAHDVTADEVARAKSAAKGGLVLALEDTGSRMTRLGKRLVTGRPLETVDDELARLDAIDLDQVRGVAKRVLEHPRSICVVGPFDTEKVARFERFVA
jgi:predicted Zn-dependent peptidase